MAGRPEERIKEGEFRHYDFSVAAGVGAAVQARRAVLGEGVDYALVLPPVNEYLLLEFLQEEKGRWFFGMKEQGLMMWLCNPANDSLWCILGAPRDRRFDNYFILTKFQVEPVISQRLSAQLLAEEEEEYGSPPRRACVFPPH